MEFVRKEPFIKDGKVVSIVVGATETDGDHSAYIDTVCHIDEADQKALSDWTEDELDAFLSACAVDKDWESVLSGQIQARKDAPISGEFVFA